MFCWDDNVHPCLWPGVTCLLVQNSSFNSNTSNTSSYQLVTGLDLSSSSKPPRAGAWELPLISGSLPTCPACPHRNGLAGTLPSELGRMRGLKSLSAEYNCLEGLIPNELGELGATLQDLKLNHNNLTGTIPASFSQLSRLTSLDLSSNSLSGPVPESWCRLVPLAESGPPDSLPRSASPSNPNSEEMATLIRTRFEGVEGLGRLEALRLDRNPRLCDPVPECLRPHLSMYSGTVGTHLMMWEEAQAYHNDRVAYKLYRSALDYRSAQRHCQVAFGGALAHFQSKDEYLTVLSALVDSLDSDSLDTDSLDSDSLDSDRLAWLSLCLSCSPFSGVWSWGGLLEPSFHCWADEDAAFQESESGLLCGVADLTSFSTSSLDVSLDPPGNYTWQKRPCDHAHPFICRRESGEEWMGGGGGRCPGNGTVVVMVPPPSVAVAAVTAETGRVALNLTTTVSDPPVHHYMIRLASQVGGVEDDVVAWKHMDVPVEVLEASLPVMLPYEINLDAVRLVDGMRYVLQVEAVTTSGPPLRLKSSPATFTVDSTPPLPGRVTLSTQGLEHCFSLLSSLLLPPSSIASSVSSTFTSASTSSSNPPPSPASSNSTSSSSSLFSSPPLALSFPSEYSEEDWRLHVCWDWFVESQHTTQEFTCDLREVVAASWEEEEDEELKDRHRVQVLHQVVPAEGNQTAGSLTIDDIELLTVGTVQYCIEVCAVNGAGLKGCALSGAFVVTVSSEQGEEVWDDHQEGHFDWLSLDWFSKKYIMGEGMFVMGLMFGGLLGMLLAMHLRRRHHKNKVKTEKQQDKLHTMAEILKVQEARHGMQPNRHSNNTQQDEHQEEGAGQSAESAAMYNTFMEKQKVVFVFTDMEGSTPLAEYNERWFQYIQDVHDAIIREVLVQAQGYEINTQGDEFQLAFASISSAVWFCMMTQQRLFEFKWPAQVLRMPYCEAVRRLDGEVVMVGPRVRMAVHAPEAGEVQMRVHDLTKHIVFNGKGVQDARNFSDIGCGGQILMSQLAWRSLRNNNEDPHRHGDEAGGPLIEHLGDFMQEKNKEPVVIYQVHPRIGSLMPKRDFRCDELRGVKLLSPGTGLNVVRPPPLLGDFPSLSRNRSAEPTARQLSRTVSGGSFMGPQEELVVVVAKMTMGGGGLDRGDSLDRDRESARDSKAEGKGGRRPKRKSAIQKLMKMKDSAYAYSARQLRNQSEILKGIRSVVQECLSSVAQMFGGYVNGGESLDSPSEDYVIFFPCVEQAVRFSMVAQVAMMYTHERVDSHEMYRVWHSVMGPDKYSISGQLIFSGPRIAMFIDVVKTSELSRLYSQGPNTYDDDDSAHPPPTKEEKTKEEKTKEEMEESSTAVRRNLSSDDPRMVYTEGPSKLPPIERPELSAHGEKSGVNTFVSRSHTKDIDTAKVLNTTMDLPGGQQRLIGNKRRSFRKMSAKEAGEFKREEAAKAGAAASTSSPDFCVEAKTDSDKTKRVSKTYLGNLFENVPSITSMMGGRNANIPFPRINRRRISRTLLKEQTFAVRTKFIGEPVEAARELCGLVWGGQTVLSEAAWMRIQLTIPQAAQVMSLGTHRVRTRSDCLEKLLLMEMMPQRLSKRHFPPPPSLTRLSRGFRDSPDPSGNTPIALVQCKVHRPDEKEGVEEGGAGGAGGAGGLEDSGGVEVSSATAVFLAAAKEWSMLVRNLLEDFDGYECKEPDLGNFTLSFKELEDAMAFCAAAQERMTSICWKETFEASQNAFTSMEGDDLEAKQFLESMDHLLSIPVSMGITYGQRVFRKPLQSTGCADYFGPMANATARIASQAAHGQILLDGDAFFEHPNFRGGNLQEQYIEHRGVPFYVSKVGLLDLKGIPQPKLVLSVQHEEYRSVPFPPPSHLIADQSHGERSSAFLNFSGKVQSSVNSVRCIIRRSFEFRSSNSVMAASSPKSFTEEIRTKEMFSMSHKRPRAAKSLDALRVSNK